MAFVSILRSAFVGLAVLGLLSFANASASPDGVAPLPAPAVPAAGVVEIQPDRPLALPTAFVTARTSAVFQLAAADEPPAPAAPAAPAAPPTPPPAPVAPTSDPVPADPAARPTPPPPPPPVLAIPDTPVVGPALGAATGPAPTARTRPPEPPPPDPEISGGDLDHRDRSIPLGPPVPPPDPFDPRHIVYRHDREVSGDGRITELRHIPQWVDVVDRRELEESRPFSIGEIVRRLPNVAVADGGSPFLAIPVIRGLSGDRVKIMTDGVWPSSQALGVAGGTLSLWDPESTEHVEIYHGPGAALRGAEAGGGVINIVPLRPHRHECFEAWGRVASAYNSADNRFRERIAAEAGSGRIAALGGVTYEDHGDRDTADGSLDPSTYSFWACDLAADYFLDNQSTIGFTGQHVEANDIRSPLGGGDAYTQPKYSRTFLAATLSSFQAGSVFHGTRMSFAFDNFLQNDDQQTDFSTTDGISSEDKVRRFDFRLQGNLYLSPCHETWAELAVSYAHLERTESILCTPPIDRAAIPFLPRGLNVEPQADPGVCVSGTAHFEANEWNVKGLIEDEMHRGCWDLHVGARFDYHHIDDDRTGETQSDLLWGAAGGVVRQLSDCWSVYANASYGQRHPSLDEMFSIAILDGRTVFPDPYLDYETSIGGEIGFRGTRYDYWTSSADVFVHHIGDYIGRKSVGNDDVWANVGDVLLYGAEASGSFRPAPCACEGLEFFGTAGVTFSDDHGVVDPMPLAGRGGARLSNCLGVPESCGFRRWFVEAAARGGLDQGFHPDDSGDSYVTAELLMGVGLGRGDRRRAVQATAGVSNLFDASYTEVYSRLPAMGRSLFVSISFDF